MTISISPCVWFQGDGHLAMARYASVVPGAAPLPGSAYPDGTPGRHGMPDGHPLMVVHQLGPTSMQALNGGPQYRPTPAVSYVLQLATAEQVDAAWAALRTDGEVLMPLQAYDWSERYGWCNDRWGVSWQVMLATNDEEGLVASALLFTGRRAGCADAAMSRYASLVPDAEVLVRQLSGRQDGSAHLQHAQLRAGGHTLWFQDSDVDHAFTFSPGNSLVATCDSQDEIDHLWHALSAVPEAEACGWLVDEFGVSWQIVPRQLGSLMSDPALARRVMPVLLKMKQLDLAALRDAAFAL